MSNTFYVATTGNNGNPGTIGSPKLTIAAGIALMQPGDTLYIRSGTYSDINISPIIGGNVSLVTTIAGYPSETVVIRPPDGNQAVLGLASTDVALAYFTFLNLTFDGIDQGEPQWGMSINIRGVAWDNIDYKNWAGSILISSDDLVIKNSRIHDQRSITGIVGDRTLGIYDHHGSNHTFQNNEIYNNPGGGIQIYPGPHSGMMVFERNNVHNNNTMNNSNVGGLTLLTNIAVSVRNNIFASNKNIAGTARAIWAAGGSGAHGIYNNTCYNNNLGIQTDIAGVIVKNNISFANDSNDILDGTGGGAIIDHNLTTDPFFLSPGSGDFHLTAGSPAIDYGVIVAGIVYTGSSPDAGALEFGGEDLPVITVDPIPPQPPTGGGTIDYDTDGDTVDIPGVGEGLPPSGSVPLPPGQTLITVIAYNINGSSIITQQVRTFASGMTYRAAAGYTPRSIKGGADLSVDNSELVGIMANKAIANQFGFLIKGVLTDQDIEVGRFDNARDELFLVNYEDLSMGKYFLPSSGGIGQIKSKRGTFESETRGKQYFLQQTFGDLISKLCRARLGDDVGDGTGEHDYKKQRFGCKVRIDPPFWRANTEYTVRPPNDAALGSVVKPNVYNGRHFECVVAGTSSLPLDTGEPAWNLAVGSTTSDGGVTWQAILALEVFGSVTGTINRRFFQDSARYEPPTTGIGINTGIAQYAIVNANIISSYFEIEGGDLTRVFLPSTTFAVTGSIANDGTYTVTVSTLIDGRTRIAVAETIPDDRAGGSIGAPNALASGFFTHGLLTFVTGLNTGITMEIKEFTLGQYPVVDVDQGAFMFMLDGDVTAQFVEGQRLAVAGSTGNDTEYNVVAVSYNIGTDQTEITVGSAIADATADGNILAGPGQFELFERMPFEIALGDEYIASAGCDLSKAMCKFKFRNIYNRRAEDETPGTDVALLTPDRPQ